MLEHSVHFHAFHTIYERIRYRLSLRRRSLKNCSAMLHSIIVSVLKPVKDIIRIKSGLDLDCI